MDPNNWLDEYEQEFFLSPRRPPSFIATIPPLVGNIATAAAQFAREEEEQAESSIRRSAPRVLHRDREGAHEKLMKHYFDDVAPVYNDRLFRKRFRMRKSLFLQITTDLEQRRPYFTQKVDATGRSGFTALQKCTSAIRQLAYGTASDSFDEYLQMSDRVSRETLLEFCKGIVKLYKRRYLRRPTQRDLRRIYEVHERIHGFPGMIGSIDCMHWEWTMCPTAWRGSHTRGDIGVPTLMLQAVASYDLWIWSAFFGMQGSNNDINVFESSPVLTDAIRGLAPTVPFTAGNNEYQMGYYLGDGIYPEYAIFVKTFTDPIDEKRRHFKMKQESARKDIERCFGVLKKQFHYLNYPCRKWKGKHIRKIMYACIILHNMILEDEGRAICQDYDPEDPTLEKEYWNQPVPLQQEIRNQRAAKNRDTHHLLRADLVEQVWVNTRHRVPEVPPPIDAYVSEEDENEG